MHKQFQINVQAIVKNNDLYLALKRNNRWTLAGGRVENDASLEDALRREVFEETSIEKMNVLGLVTALLSDSKQHVLLYFLVETNQSSITLSHEHEDYGWFSLAEIDNLDWEHDGLKKIILSSAK